MEKHVFLFVLFSLLPACTQTKTENSPKELDLTNTRPISFEKLNQDQYLQLLQNQQGKLLKEYKEKYNVEVHELTTGEVLLNDNTGFAKYSNLNDLNYILQEFAERGVMISSVLENENPYGKDFPNHTLKLIIELKKELGIEHAGLDTNLLTKIDGKMSILPNTDSFRKQHLLHFIAVIGEVFNTLNNAKWKMVLDKDGRTWNPYIETNDQDLEFFIDLYEYIFIKRNEADFHVLTVVYETTQHMARRSSGYRVDKKPNIFEKLWEIVWNKYGRL